MNKEQLEKASLLDQLNNSRDDAFSYYKKSNELLNDSSQQLSNEEKKQKTPLLTQVKQGVIDSVKKSFSSINKSIQNTYHSIRNSMTTFDPKSKECLVEKKIEEINRNNQLEDSKKRSSLKNHTRIKKIAGIGLLFLLGACQTLSAKPVSQQEVAEKFSNIDNIETSTFVDIQNESASDILELSKEYDESESIDKNYIKNLKMSKDSNYIDKNGNHVSIETYKRKNSQGDTIYRKNKEVVDAKTGDKQLEGAMFDGKVVTLTKFNTEEGLITVEYEYDSKNDSARISSFKVRGMDGQEETVTFDQNGGILRYAYTLPTGEAMIIDTAEDYNALFSSVPTQDGGTSVITSKTAQEKGTIYTDISKQNVNPDGTTTVDYQIKSAQLGETLSQGK